MQQLMGKPAAMCPARRRCLTGAQLVVKKGHRSPKCSKWSRSLLSFPHMCLAKQRLLNPWPPKWQSPHPSWVLPVTMAWAHYMDSSLGWGEDSGFADQQSKDLN